MIGRIIEESGQKVIQTLAGATAGTVCKVNYGSDSNYAIPLTLNEAGEGYVGVSCVCPIFYNPSTGTLTVDNICSTSSNAECADKVKSNSLSGDTVYNLAIWCATSDGNYNSMGFSGGRSITYNPYTATLNACCGNFTNVLHTNALTIDNSVSLGISGTTFERKVAEGEYEDVGFIDTNGMLNWYCHITATCFCGNATSATNATTATTACYLSLCGNTSAGIYAEVGYSNEFNLYSPSDAHIWFNYRGGINTIKVGNGSGTGCLGTLCASCLCANKLYAGTGGIDTCYDIVGRCDESPYDETWYIYCDGEACFRCVDACEDIYSGGYIVITENTINNYLTCQCRVSLEQYLACTSLCSNVLYLVY